MAGDARLSISWSAFGVSVRLARVLIREAAVEDLDLVVTLRLRFLAEHRHSGSDEFPASFVATTREFLYRHLEAGTARSWLATDEGAVMGVVTMLILDLVPRPEDRSGLEGYIVNMYVDRAHRRRGVGKALLGQCLVAATEIGLRQLLLYATDDGRSLYTGAGFVMNLNWMELSL